MTKAFPCPSVTVYVPCLDDQKKQETVHERGVGSSPKGHEVATVFETVSYTLPRNTYEIKESDPKIHPYSAHKRPPRRSLIS